MLVWGFLLLSFRIGLISSLVFSSYWKCVRYRLREDRQTRFLGHKPRTNAGIGWRNFSFCMIVHITEGSRLLVDICYKQSSSYQKIRIVLCDLFVLLEEMIVFGVPNIISLSTARYRDVLFCFSGGSAVSVFAKREKELKMLETGREEAKNLGIMMCANPWGLRTRPCRHIWHKSFLSLHKAGTTWTPWLEQDQKKVVVLQGEKEVDSLIYKGLAGNVRI